MFVLPDEVQGPRKRPKILPGSRIDEKSKEVCFFLCRFSVMIVDVLFTFLVYISVLPENYIGLQFRKKLKSVALDGVDILAAAKDACQKSLARQEAKEGAAKAKAKKEEERVAELRRIRGERWLPSIAREMQVTSISI